MNIENKTLLTSLMLGEGYHRFLSSSPDIVEVSSASSFPIPDNKPLVLVPILQQGLLSIAFDAKDTDYAAPHNVYYSFFCEMMQSVTRISFHMFSDCYLPGGPNFIPMHREVNLSSSRADDPSLPGDVFYLCEAEIEIPIRGELSQIEYALLSYNDAFLRSCKENLSEGDMISLRCKQLSGTLLDQYVYSFVEAFARINYLMEHPEHKQIRMVDANQVAQTPRSEDYITKENTRRKIIDLNQIRISSCDSNTVKMIQDKKSRRITASWNVRGHFRHYASGKTVFVKPYRKGSKDGHISSKKYRISTSDDSKDGNP